MLPEASFKVWTKTVETQGRFRIGAEIATVVRWLKATNDFHLECLAILGHLGQLQIVTHPPVPDLAKELQTRLAEAHATTDEVAVPWVDFARFAGTAWKVSCTFDVKEKRFTIVLPSDTRKLGITPAAGEHAVVFAIGEIVEIWKAENWVQHIRKIRSTLPTIVENSWDALQDRQK